MGFRYGASDFGGGSKRRIGCAPAFSFAGGENIAGTVARIGCARCALLYKPPAQCARLLAMRGRLRFSAVVSARAPCASAIASNSCAVNWPRLSGRVVTVLGFAPPRSMREIVGDVGGVIFLEVAQRMVKKFCVS